MINPEKEYEHTNKSMHKLIIAVRKELGAWDTPELPTTKDIERCILNKIKALKENQK